MAKAHDALAFELDSESADGEEVVSRIDPVFARAFFVVHPVRASGLRIGTLRRDRRHVPLLKRLVVQVAFYIENARVPFPSIAGALCRHCEKIKQPKERRAPAPSHTGKGVETTNKIGSMGAILLSQNGLKSRCPHYSHGMVFGLKHRF